MRTGVGRTESHRVGEIAPTRVSGAWEIGARARQSLCMRRSLWKASVDVKSVDGAADTRVKHRIHLLGGCLFEAPQLSSCSTSSVARMRIVNPLLLKHDSSQLESASELRERRTSKRGVERHLKSAAHNMAESDTNGLLRAHDHTRPHCLRSRKHAPLSDTCMACRDPHPNFRTDDNPAGDAKLDFEEFYAMQPRSIREAHSQEDVRAWFESADLDGNGVLSVNEVHSIPDSHSPAFRLSPAFDFAPLTPEKRGSRRATLQFFLWAVRNASATHGVRALVDVFDEHDENGSGKLDMREFEQLCMSEYVTYVRT